MLPLRSEFWSPDNPPGSNPPVETKSVDTIEFLSEETDEKDVLDLKAPTKKADSGDEKDEEETLEAAEDKEETEEDELAEIEAELEGPPEEKLELVTPVRRKEILAKYPSLFKDFPQLENSYYRDQQFTEMFGTVKDAKVVAEKADILDRFEGEILSGSITNILKAAKEENPRGFLKIADNYLSTLAEVDNNAFMHVLANMTKHTIQAMVKEGRKTGNDTLMNAAQILNQYVFGSSDWTPPSQLSQETQEEQKQNTEQNAREQAFLYQQFDNTRSELDTKVNNTLRNTIEANIDPRGTMSDYVRKNAVKDAMETLSGLLERDTRFNGLKDKLWEKIFDENFSRESQDRVRSAFLSRAKTLLPSVIKKARNEALRGTGHRVRDDEDTTPPKGPVPSGKPRTQHAGKVKDAKDIPKGMSTLDFLNSD